MRRTKISFILVEDLQKQEKDFQPGIEITKELRDKLFEKQKEVMEKEIRDLFTCGNYEWVEDLTILPIQEEDQ